MKTYPKTPLNWTAIVSVLLVALLWAVASPVHAQTVVIDFEDLAPDSTYYVGQSFASGAMLFCVEPFTWSNGQVTARGEVYPVTGMTVTDSRELYPNNSIVRFGFRGQLQRIEMDYGSHGGNINFDINGQRRYDFSHPDDVNGEEIDGVRISAEQNADGTGHLVFEGEIDSFAIGGQEFAFDNVQLSGDFSPDEPCSLSAVRALLVTQGNRTAEYHISIQPGVARQQPNQFNQWLVVHIDGEREPLDVYGIWDPRLAIVHELEQGQSTIEFDPDTAYLFDIVIPFNQSQQRGLPLETLIFDQSLQLIADVHLAPTIAAFCAERIQENTTCQAIDRDALEVDPITELPGTGFFERPEAISDLDLLEDSDLVRACLGSVSESPADLADALRACGIVLR